MGEAGPTQHPPPTPPPHQGARPVSPKPLAGGASTLEKPVRLSGPSPRCGPRAPPWSQRVQDCKSGDWSGQGWGPVPAPLGLFTQWKGSLQAPEGRGRASHLSQRFPAPRQAVSSTGVLFGQGASLSCHQGQVLGTMASEGTVEPPGAEGDRVI